MYEKTNSLQLCMDLQPYSHDCNSKISITLFDFLNNTYWVSFFQRNNSLIFRTGVCCSSVTLFYFTLLALTHRQNHRRRNKYTGCSWAKGTFFQLCCCVSFWFWREIGFGFIYYVLMYLEYNTVVVLCQFFGSGQKQFLVLRMYLVFKTVVQLYQFFGCGGKLFSK